MSADYFFDADYSMQIFDADYLSADYFFDSLLQIKSVLQ